MQAARRRTLAAGAATAALALTLGGCSGGEDPETASSATSSSASAGESSGNPTDSPTGSPTGSPSDSASDSASGSAAPEDAAGSRTFTVAGTYVKTRNTMRFDLVSLKRRGDLLELVANLTNTTTDQSQDHRWQVAGRFQGTYRKDLSTTDGTFSGAVLTDLEGKKRYFVAADSAQACVCTTGLSSTFVDAGQTVELTATYAAPPESTTQLDVDVPGVGVFRDVPVG